MFWLVRFEMLLAGVAKLLSIKPRVTDRLWSWQNFRPLIHMTGADFDAITHERALCDADGAIGAVGFEIMMREQVRGVY